MNTRDSDVQALNTAHQASLSDDFQIEIIELPISEADREGLDVVFFRSTTTTTTTTC